MSLEIPFMVFISTHFEPAASVIIFFSAMAHILVVPHVVETVLYF